MQQITQGVLQNKSITRDANILQPLRSVAI